MGASAGPDIFEDGLVFYVDGANSKSYPGSGTTWYDLVNGYDGTLTNGASISNGVAIFDGIDDYTNIDPVVSPLLSTTQGTWMGWVKPTDATPASLIRIIAFGDTNVNEWIALFINTDGTLLLRARNSTEIKHTIKTDSATLSDGVWSHIAVVQDGSGFIIYIDGVKYSPSEGNATYIESVDTSWWFSDTVGIDNGRIGCMNWANQGNKLFFDGSINQVLIYNTALSSAQVLQNFNATKERYL